MSAVDRTINVHSCAFVALIKTEEGCVHLTKLVNMSSFTQDQVRTFRQIFSLFNDEERGGLPRENFVPAALESLEHCNLSSQPSDVYLAGEFNRLAGDSGVVNWQQFFQVSIRLVSLSPQASPTNMLCLPGTYSRCCLATYCSLFDVYP